VSGREREAEAETEAANETDVNSHMRVATAETAKVDGATKRSKTKKVKPASDDATTKKLSALADAAKALGEATEPMAPTK